MGRIPTAVCVTIFTERNGILIKTQCLLFENQPRYLLIELRDVDESKVDLAAASPQQGLSQCDLTLT
jgi:hypothetical protein